MITVKFCVAAEGASRDADSNVVTLFNILEGMMAAGFPFFIPRIAFVVLWERDGQDADVVGHFRARLGDTTLVEADMNVNFQGFPRTRTLINLNGIVIPRPGTLILELTLANEAHTHAQYMISVEGPPAQAVVVGGADHQ